MGIHKFITKNIFIGTPYLLLVEPSTGLSGLLQTAFVRKNTNTVSDYPIVNGVYAFFVTALYQAG